MGSVSHFTARTSHARRSRLLLPSALLLLAALAPTAAAQPIPDCGALLSEAHEHYTEQRFDDAEQAGRACLEGQDVSDDDAVAAHRLLALVHLRQDDATAAEQEVVHLLAVTSNYTPDPILDPPPYVALVGTLRDRLHTTEATPEPVLALQTVVDPSTEAAFMPTPASRVIHVSLSLGAGSYSGERGINGESLADEFRLNGGVSFALDGSYALDPTLTAVASYRAVRFPLLLTNDVRAEDVHVRPEDSSAWVHVLALMVRGYVATSMYAQPYVQAGVSGFFSHLNDEMRIGLGPQLGLGVDLPVTPDLTGFAELNVAVSFPGDAVDRVSTSGSSDALTFMGAGLRYRVRLP